MFEALITLMLSALFIQSQADEQTVLEELMTQKEQQLELAEVRGAQATAPQIDPSSESVGVEVTAQSVLVVDSESGKVLYEKDSLEVRSIASITKLMTALVFIDNNPGWENEVIIQSSDYRMGGINYLIAGEKITTRDIFYAMLIASSNEGAVALARSTGLSLEEFVKQMNEKAKEIGMTQATFTDVTGLSEGNMATAADVIVLLQTALNNPDLKNATSQKDYLVGIINKGITRRVRTTDKLLGKQLGVDNNIFGVLAGKTGYLKKAGYCFASEVENNNGNKILAVVLGSNSINNRFQDTKSLAYWVFNNYIWQ